MAPAKTSNVLAQKAVLAGLTVRQWGGRKLDKKITDEVNRSHGAAADAGNYNKLLLEKKHFVPIDKITNEARTKFLILTMPWLDTGTRILPAVKVDDFFNEMRKYERDFNAAVDKFNKDYPTAVEEARKRLNGMFNANDYPAASRVRKLFAFETSLTPCPDSADFRVALAKEQAEDIKADLDKRMKNALTVAMQDPVNRIVVNVEHMVERLTAYTPGEDGEKAKGWFRDSLVENLRGLVDLLPAFNLTGDPRLTAITERVKAELTVADAKVLREDEAVREQVREAAEDILDQARALMA